MEDHVHHLKLVLEILHKHQLYARQFKCSFACSKISYLGHLISQYGVKVADPFKIESMLNQPISTTLKSLQGFLGLTEYYKKFIKNYSLIASSPLTALLRKDSFIWSKESELAFQALMQTITYPPILALHNFTKNFTIQCNASYYGIGAVQLHLDRPIAFMSQALGGKTLNLSVYENEQLALMSVVRKG